MLVTKYSDFGVNAHACTNCLNSTSSGSDKVDDAVSAAATAEAEGDEHQDAGDANWRGNIGLLKKYVLLVLIVEKL